MVGYDRTIFCPEREYLLIRIEWGEPWFILAIGSYKELLETQNTCVIISAL